MGECIYYVRHLISCFGSAFWLIVTLWLVEFFIYQLCNVSNETRPVIKLWLTRTIPQTLGHTYKLSALVNVTEAVLLFVHFMMFVYFTVLQSFSWYITYIQISFEILHNFFEGQCLKLCVSG